MSPLIPVINGQATVEEWQDVMHCHFYSSPPSDDPVCNALARCRDRRCGVVAALGSSSYQVMAYFIPNTGGHLPGYQAPTTLGTLAIQRLLRRHPDRRELTEAMLVTLARDLQDFLDYSIIFAIATLVDPSGVTEHRMADAVPFTPDFDQAILRARDSCDVGRRRACDGIRR